MKGICIRAFSLKYIQSKNVSVSFSTKLYSMKAYIWSVKVSPASLWFYPIDFVVVLNSHWDMIDSVFSCHSHYVFKLALQARWRYTLYDDKLDIRIRFHPKHYRSSCKPYFVAALTKIAYYNLVLRKERRRKAKYKPTTEQSVEWDCKVITTLCVEK